MATKKILFLLTFIILVLFASGCTGDLSAEEIAEQMQEKEANIQDYSYTMQMTSHFGNQTQESEIQFLQKKPDKMKTVTLKPEEEAGTIVVSDGEFIWTYDPKTNTVTKMEMPETPTQGETDYVGIISDLLNETDVSLLGMEEIDGRSAYLLETSLKDEEEGFRFTDGMKLWVDKETWMPLRYEIYDSGGDPMMELEIRDLEINTDIPDSEFVLEVPEGATVKTIDLGSFELPEEITLEEAREAAGFEFLVPEYLPEGYAFNYSMVSNESLTVPEEQTLETVILRYENDKGNIISLSETVYEKEIPEDSEAAITNYAENVTINGIDGKYLAFGDMKILRWEIEDIDLILTTSLEKDEVLRIAESLQETA
ncbi:TPA: outer membrane lipoprotein-sorting protein [Methanosarcina acetivorans]|nr:outer membrane lipoprotein-sorting protein [Methanosarcina acetivorans]HIH92677.1 outer membrane lipoprotein-sorting protein [Methanosarcina acetivorans]